MLRRRAARRNARQCRPSALNSGDGDTLALPPSSVHLVLSAFRWCLRVLASLQLAVVLIAIYAIVLGAATIIEAFQRQLNLAVAHFDVYHANWFIALNIVLAVNVLCAMLIRLPWRRRQIGFLLTHGGILVLLAGCAMTHRKGIDAQLPIYEGHANHITAIERPQTNAENEKGEPLALGFQVYLHQFRRRLDPGSTMPSYYSSRVDFLERSDPPKPLNEEKTLRKDVLIELNKPVDFTDPQTSRTYRFFQADFDGPWLPGDAEFDKQVGNDRSRDQVYLSVLSVNYDPGRWLKYAGSFLIVVGMGMVYYLRGEGRGTRDEGRGTEEAKARDGESTDAACGLADAAKRETLPGLLLGIVILLSASGAAPPRTSSLIGARGGICRRLPRGE